MLRTRGLRQLANRMAYHDKDRLATEDAMRIGRLHTHCPGGQDCSGRCCNAKCFVFISVMSMQF